MAKKKKNKSKRRRDEEKEDEDKDGGWLRHETKRSIWGVVSLVLPILLVLGRFHKAGPVGEIIFKGLDTLLGWGYFIFPTSLFLAALALLFSKRKRPTTLVFIGALILVLSFLGLVEIFASGEGGWAGLILGSLRTPFGNIAATVINIAFLIISILVTLNIPLKLTFSSEGGSAFGGKKKEDDSYDDVEESIPNEEEKEDDQEDEEEEKENSEEENEEAQKKEENVKERVVTKLFPSSKKKPALKIKDYVAPPISLLKSSTEKPTTGDLRANANIIKRTLESFGIQVEMGEINIGPKVTRYTLKPAEGMKLSRITALNQDLALALATHPIRIEAPIPGRSLVGIEVPNKAAALVRLGSLMLYPEFNSAGALAFALGRNVSGEPVFANIDKMPHLLVAGATGSGKSITIHSILTSLIYKNSPATLKLILVDPKRVELSAYDGLPHLATPVITENKKAINALRWAISEMDRRYDILMGAGRRDISSYNSSNPEEPLPYLIIVVDELADLMTSYGRDVEGAIVRLAQMARATGIHLILSTQRPSVEIITGLIKANITSRIALQVASQIDSRTILDTGGAEKLLGGGDLLFISSELSKPKRIQGAFLTEDEVTKVTDFIKEHNQFEYEEELDLSGKNSKNGENGKGINDVLDGFSPERDEDELFDEAVAIIREAEKASASFLQRRLKIGYARAARLLDLMEEHELIGPGEGAKPREVFVEKIDTRLEGAENEDEKDATRNEEEE